LIHRVKTQINVVISPTIHWGEPGSHRFQIIQTHDFEKIPFAFLLMLAVVTASQAQEQGKFRVGLEAGHIMPSFRGAICALEPKTNIADNMNSWYTLGVYRYGQKRPGWPRFRRGKCIIPLLLTVVLTQQAPLRHFLVQVMALVPLAALV
tara:strand:- start:2118 stop:2567 length:450 start_codon:yes stop_codon:yes gene_type:complete